ncbi:unnamed protein product, partial [marine sediment metagenome]
YKTSQIWNNRSTIIKNHQKQRFHQLEHERMSKHLRHTINLGKKQALMALHLKKYDKRLKINQLKANKDVQLIEDKKYEKIEQHRIQRIQQLKSKKLKRIENEKKNTIK